MNKHKPIHRDPDTLLPVSPYPIKGGRMRTAEELLADLDRKKEQRRKQALETETARLLGKEYDYQQEEAHHEKRWQQIEELAKKVEQATGVSLAQLRPVQQEILAEEYRTRLDEYKRQHMQQNSRKNPLKQLQQEALDRVTPVDDLRKSYQVDGIEQDFTYISFANEGGFIHGVYLRGTHWSADEACDECDRLGIGPDVCCQAMVVQFSAEDGVAPETLERMAQNVNRRLSEAEMRELFEGMTRAEYEALPESEK